MKPILQGMALVTAFAVVALLVVVAATGGWPKSSPRAAAATQVGGATSSMASSGSGTANAGMSGSGTSETNTTTATTPATGNASSGETTPGETTSGEASAGTTTTGTTNAAAGSTGASPGTSAADVANSQDGGQVVKIGARTLNGNAQAGLNVFERGCLSCHNRDGQSYIPQYPRLSAQVASYTAEQLQAFASGTRANAIMTPIAQGLTPQQMADLSAYLAVAPAAKEGWGSVNDELRGRGEQLYRQGNGKGAQACMACHGAAGEGQPAAGFPRLAGQSPTYLVDRLGEYARMSADTAGNAGVMAKIAKALTGDERRAIAEYLKTVN